MNANIWCQLETATAFLWYELREPTVQGADSSLPALAVGVGLHLQVHFVLMQKCESTINGLYAAPAQPICQAPCSEPQALPSGRLFRQPEEPVLQAEVYL